MSAGIDTMLYVGETPWHNLGTHYDVAPKTSQEIIQGAKLGWEVGAAPMKTELHDKVLGYHTIYREDNNEILGVVNNARPRLVQNSETFNAFDHLIGSEIEVETAASLGIGETVFGCFKIKDQYKLVDDAVDHYFVVMNDHLKVDGKVTVLNTPVRVVCQNTLSAALSNNYYKVRIPITNDSGINYELATKILASAGAAIDQLGKKAEKMLAQKVSRESLEKVLDELFPYIQADGMSLHNKTNERVSMMRSTFLSCMAADNLANYRGTSYQIFNALTDYTQHYFRNVDKCYDLNHRMQLLPGIGVDSEPNKVSKFLSIADKLIA